ncbi:hypothetical protein MferCBS31731_000812 [Microsporum ferrugineum]
MARSWLIVMLGCVICLSAKIYAAPTNHSAGHNQTSKDEIVKMPVIARGEVDATSFAWVHNMAAIGDSFTAGIGSGYQLGSFFYDRASWYCSRYDLAYPELIRQIIGPSLNEYQFIACSGDRSSQIYEQVKELKKDIDMVVMTAGGNDLCLAAMIKNCIMLPYNGEETCNVVIDQAQKNIDTILKPNLKQILMALDDKMAKDGIVVYNGYARFFNTEDEKCATDQQWNILHWYLKYWFKTPLTLTVERRKKFNVLVENINKAIREVVKDVSDEVDYNIGFSDWDLWAIEGVDGQMCDPASTGKYPDKNQPDLQFFKGDTHIRSWFHDELKRRHIESVDEGKVNHINKDIYNSLLWKSPSPRAEILHRLDKRAPSPPNCPGDNDWPDSTLGLGLPDSFGKLFHPNELGHQTIASFALAEAIDLRAKVLGLEPQSCEITDEFKCWQKVGRKGYVTATKADENYKDFCNGVVQPSHTVGWTSEKTYFKDTPDEHTFKVQLGKNTADFNKKECLESFERIIHGCDGNDVNNPLNWKFGGMWRRGEYTYELNVKRENRPWPLKSPYGFCEGIYRAIYSSYTLKGAGFSSWDSGQETLVPNMKSCFGLGLTAYNFKYFSEPDKDGMEWEVTFKTPIWVQARCFNNNKVVFAAGGFTNGCRGTG